MALIGLGQQHHARVEWLKFLRKIDRGTPKGRLPYQLRTAARRHLQSRARDKWRDKPKSDFQVVGMQVEWAPKLREALELHFRPDARP